MRTAKTAVQTPSDNITFEKIVRDSRANKEGKENGWPLTYDWNVLINSEHRATLRKNIGTGYRLYDPDDKAISDGSYPKHLGIFCKKQADFFQFIGDNLHRIPTLPELAEKRRQRAELLAQIRKEAEQAVRDRAAEKNAAELLEMLKFAKPLLERLNEQCTQDTVFIQRVRAVIAKAEDVGTAEQFEAAVEQIEWDLKRRGGIW